MSRTARMVTAYRARASARPEAIIDDRFAAALAGEDGTSDADAYAAARPNVELFIALRTAFLDRAVREAIRDGVDQIAILGAGYDSRAARLARRGVRFFEVDRESTQEAKRARIETIDDYPKDAATYVRCDFETDDFVERLSAAGFDRERPAVFLWEGVVYYLGEAAVRATLRTIASRCHPESRLYFDYLGKKFVRGESNDPSDRDALERLSAMGEPLRFGIDHVVPLASETGFRFVRTLTFDAIALELTGTYDRERLMRFQSIAELRVQPPREGE
jgi:methyltransferase (TIGR00027 family)